ncbi:cbb3-type cytochrome c oxidase subunit II, partial [Vibrio parahaemolyticus]
MATNIFHGHKLIERHVTLLAVLALLTVAIGGLVEIAPLFWIESTVRH